MELYPRIGKNFDIKLFTNCRFGMMSWAVLVISYCIKQVTRLIRVPNVDLSSLPSRVKQHNEAECDMDVMGHALVCLSQYSVHGEVAGSLLVSSGLMLVYITKFFIWETGYLCSMDIAHDRGAWCVFSHLLHLSWKSATDRHALSLINQPGALS